MELWIYMDMDNGVYEIFKTLEAAHAFRAEEHPDVEDEDDYEYVIIEKRTVRS